MDGPTFVGLAALAAVAAAGRHRLPGATNRNLAAAVVATTAAALALWALTRWYGGATSFGGTPQLPKYVVFTTLSAELLLGLACRWADRNITRCDKELAEARYKNKKGARMRCKTAQSLRAGVLVAWWSVAIFVPPTWHGFAVGYSGPLRPSSRLLALSEGEHTDALAEVGVATKLRPVPPRATVLNGTWVMTPVHVALDSQGLDIGLVPMAIFGSWAISQISSPMWLQGVCHFVMWGAYPYYSTPRLTTGQEFEVRRQAAVRGTCKVESSGSSFYAYNSLSQNHPTFPLPKHDWALLSCTTTLSTPPTMAPYPPNPQELQELRATHALMGTKRLGACVTTPPPGYEHITDVIFCTSGVVGPGWSGAPVTRGDGQVVGMVQGGDPNQDLVIVVTPPPVRGQVPASPRDEL